MANLLAALLGPSKPIGTGLAENARQNLSGRGYQLAVEEAKAAGETPPTYAQWAATQK